MWPHLIKSLNTRQSYTDWATALKLSASDLTRAALGGGGILPLLDFCDNSRTALDIDTKFAVPSFASIGHMLWKSWRNPSENLGKKSYFYDATTRDFRAKTSQYSNGHICFNYWAISDFKTPKGAECWAIQSCHLKVSKFSIFNLEIFKKWNVAKNAL